MIPSRYAGGFEKFLSFALLPDGPGRINLIKWAIQDQRLADNVALTPLGRHVQHRQNYPQVRLDGNRLTLPV